MLNKPPKNAKQLSEFPGYYITPDGDIWSSLKKPYVGYRKLNSQPDNSNHLGVTLYKNKQKFSRRVHRMVLETFVGLRPKGMQCCHKNDIKTDNRLENLYWGTPSDNRKDAFRNKRCCHRGERHPGSKLNELQVRIIRRLLEFNSLTQKEMGRIFNVSRSTVGKIKQGKNWGYIC